jgi:hypothetical protein
MSSPAPEVSKPEPAEPGETASGPRSFSGWKDLTTARIGLDTYAKGGRPREIEIDFAPPGIVRGEVEMHLATVLAEAIRRLKVGRQHDALLPAREAAEKCAERLQVYLQDRG